MQIKRDPTGKWQVMGSQRPERTVKWKEAAQAIKDKVVMEEV